MPKEKTLEQVEKILSKISFAPSCLDLGYKFEVKDTVDGFLIRASFQRPDSYKNGEIGTGYGRWMHVPKDVSESGIVKTTWLCLELIVKHECMEMFKYCEKRVFSPHRSVNDLCSFKN